MKIIDFNARYVDCADAIEGEILQVTFDTMPGSFNESNRATPYVLISHNFEFPGPPTIEWHDGHDYDGGGRLGEVTLTRTKITIQVGQTLTFEVGFRLSDKKFAELSSFLTTMIKGLRIVA